MHSHDIAALSRMAKLCNCSIFVKNGRSVDGLGDTDRSSSYGNSNATRFANRSSANTVYDVLG